MRRSTETKSWLRGATGRPFLVAHRGYSDVAPENTLVAFEKAIEVGAEVLECDVQMTGDGVAVTLHDALLDRTTDGSGPVRERTWNELGTIDAGYSGRFGAAFSGARIPRLEELLDLAKDRAEVLVEIKPEAVAERSGRVEERVVVAARRTGTLDSIGVLSFAPLALERVHALHPSVPTGLVFSRWRRYRMVAQTAAVGACILVGHTANLWDRPGLILTARRRGLRVAAYVVDAPEQVLGLARIGVQGLITNRIGELLPVLDGLDLGDARGEVP